MLLLEAVQSAAACWQLRLLVAFAAVRARSPTRPRHPCRVARLLGSRARAPGTARAQLFDV